MWGLSDSAYKNTSIHDGSTWSEIIPKKKSLVNKNSGQGDLVIAINYRECDSQRYLSSNFGVIQKYWYLAKLNLMAT